MAVVAKVVGVHAEKMQEGGKGGKEERWYGGTAVRRGGMGTIFRKPGQSIDLAPLWFHCTCLRDLSYRRTAVPPFRPEEHRGV